MQPFRRVIRFLILLSGLVAGLLAVAVVYFSRMLISPPRKPLWATPDEIGLPYQDVHFPARDGLRLSGWFIPAKQDQTGKPVNTIVLVHGWPWNRLGTTAESVLTDLPGSGTIQLLQLAAKLYQAGYQLLLFDLRNHGQSAASPPVTFGLREANDLLGAIDCLASREDVDKERIGVVGFSAGANTVLFSLPRTTLIKAAVAVQPTSPSIFSTRYAHSLLGPLAKPILPLVELIYASVSGMSMAAIEPLFAVSGAGPTPVLYVQGKGDRWGSLENVVQMASITPNAVEPLYVESDDRFGGYQFVIDHPEILDRFFQKHL